MSDLKQKTIKGLFWSGFSQVGKQISQFIIIAILARLLSPNDFGLLAMATVFINFGMIFSEMGISSALIQKQDTHDRHYYSAFWFNVIVGIALTLIFISVSPLIAWFYKKPELQLILTVISINYFISSFVIIQQTILTKEMDFRSLAIRDIIAMVLSGGIGIYMAFHGFGVWSLVFQSIALTLFNAILLWVLSSWRPKYQFAKSDIKDIFGFSANLTGFNIVNYFARNIDQLLIGKFLGVQALGYYSLAYKLMLYPLQNISWVISKVMFPALSKIKNDLEKVRKSYLKMIKSISTITFPLMIALFLVAPEFVKLFFGQKWEPIVILIRIFSICGMIQSLSTTMGNIILSQGRSDIQLKLGVWGTVWVVISVLIGMHWGFIGVATCYTICQLIWLPYAQNIANRLVNLNFKCYLLNIRREITLMLGIFIFGMILNVLIGTQIYYIKFIIIVLVTTVFASRYIYRNLRNTIG